MEVAGDGAPLVRGRGTPRRGRSKGVGMPSSRTESHMRGSPTIRGGGWFRPGRLGVISRLLGELPSKKSGETQEDIPAKAAYVLLHDIAGGGSAPVTLVVEIAKGCLPEALIARGRSWRQVT